MKSLFWFLGVIIAGLLLMALAGLFVSRHHTVAVTIRLQAQPTPVFATLVDFLNSSAWRSDIEHVERLVPRDGKVSFREYGEHGPVTYVVEEFLAATHLVVSIEDAELPYGGRWIYLLEPEGGGTRITITEEGFVKNPLLRFLSHYVLSQTTTLERYLVDLGAHFDEQVTPQVIPVVATEGEDA
jgi:hypothetical protein